MSIDQYTKLKVTNNTKEPVEVFVTLAAQNSSNLCCPSPAGLTAFSFLQKVNELQGKFTLPAKSSQEFDSGGACFSGNIGFYVAPQCPNNSGHFHTGKSGTNIAEFTLNPDCDCQEAFDISCVNGINCYMEMTVGEDQGWHYGPDKTPVSKIFNRALQENAGNPGVYPVNCTDCIRLVGDKPCPTLPLGPAQSERICNVVRSERRGGTVEVTLTRPVDC